MDATLLSFIICPRCGGDLEAIQAQEYKLLGAHEELLCCLCKVRYPVISGVPIIFTDDKIIRLILDGKIKDTAVSRVTSITQATSSGRNFTKRERYLASSDQEVRAEAVAWEYPLKPWLDECTPSEGHKQLLDFIAEHETSGRTSKSYMLVAELTPA